MNTVREQALLGEIEAFMAATQMLPSQFGVRAVNDAKLVKQLRDGRELRSETRERVRDFMSRYRDDVNGAVKGGAAA